MPHYYFHLHDGIDVLLDPDGVERPTLDQAVLAALAGARDIMSAGVKDGRLEMNGRIDVEDEQGRVVHTLRFDEAVRITGL